MKIVVFCATQRTGSSVIVDDFFNLLGGNAVDAEYLTTELFKLRTESNWDGLWSKVKSANFVSGVVAIKVMFHYICYIADFISGSSPPEEIRAVLDADYSRLRPFQEFFADAVWVYIQRRDVAEQAVSVFFAQRTDVWERRSSEAVGVVPVPDYNKDRLFAIVRDLKQETLQWTSFFTHFNISPIGVEYNDVVINYPNYLDPLYDHLNLKRDACLPQRRMHKLGGKTNCVYAERLRSDYLAEFGTVL